MKSDSIKHWGKLTQYVVIGVVVLCALGILTSIISAQMSPVLVAGPVVNPLVSTTTVISRASDPLTVALSHASTSVEVGNFAVRVAIVDTPAERDQGLGGVTSLLPDEGMLFVFQRDSRYAFWMKDMLFSIDMVWISADKHIVYIAPNVAPDTYPEPFIPSQPARYVLELPAGFSTAHHLQIGEAISF